MANTTLTKRGLSKLSIFIVPIITFILFFQGCDKPSAPDFNLQSSVQAPLLFNKKYQVLGSGSGALIDTTKDSFDSLFVVDPSDELITLSQEQDISIGDLDDVVPEVDVDPTEVATEIGIIEVDDFSTGLNSKVGTLEEGSKSTDSPTNAEVGNFEPDINGSGSATRADFGAPTGTGNIPSGSGDATISIDAGDFVSATVVDGGLRLEFTNNLGIDLDNLSTQLKSNGSDVGSQISFSEPNDNLSNGSTFVDTVKFNNPPTTVEDPLSAFVSISWSNQNATNGSGLEVAISDANLVASDAQSDIPAQQLDPTTPDISIGGSDFSYAILANDSEGGTVNGLTITIENNTNLPLTNSTQSGTPEIELINSDGATIGTSKSFVDPNNTGANEIAGTSTGEVTFDLSGKKLTKKLSYTLDLGTAGGNNLSVSSTDAITITSQTQTLKVKEAKSAIDAQSNIAISDTNSVEGDFVRAEVEEGTLNFTFRNTLAIPMTINSLTIENKSAFKAKNTGRFFAAGSEIGSLTDVVIAANSTQSESIPLAGKGISDEIVIDGTASSDGSGSDPKTVKSSDLIEVDVTGSISVNEAETALDPQSFNSSDVISIGEDAFIFNSTDDYIQLNGGILRIDGIVNQLDVNIDTLDIEVSSLFDPNGDPLTIKFQGNADGGYQSYQYRQIERNENENGNGTRDPIEIELSGFKISSSSNDLNYSLSGKTASTHGLTDSLRVINSRDSVSASLNLQNLEIGEAVGTVATKEVFLNNDESSNGTDLVDLFNNDEAEVDSLSDLQDISERLDEIQLNNTAFNLFYDSNLGVEATLYMVMVGVDSKGNEAYLKPKSGSDYAMDANESVTGLHANGSPVPKENILKISLDAAQQMGQTSQGVIAFNSTNSEVDDFLSNLPTEIRFIAKAVANPNGKRGFVTTPIDFATTLGFDIPINFAASTGPNAINDTLEVDLSDLPKPGDDATIKEGVLTIEYTSGLPFGVDMAMDFLDDNDEVIVTIPDQSSSYSLQAATVDNSTGFVTQPVEDKMVIALNEQQLEQLHKARNIHITGGMATANDGAMIKLRSSDYIELTVKSKFTINFSVGN